MAKKDKPAPKERTLRGYETPSTERDSKPKKRAKGGKPAAPGSTRPPRKK